MATDTAELETEAPASAPRREKRSSKKASKPKTAAKPKATAEFEYSQNQIEVAANTIKMAADKNRVKLLTLADGVRTVGDLCDILKQSQPAVSHHLALLRHSGLLRPIRTGKNNLYETTKLGKVVTKAINMVLEAGPEDEE